MKRAVRPLVRAMLLLVLSLVLSVTLVGREAVAQTMMDGQGVRGWRVTLGAGNNVYFASPEEACQAMWTYYQPFPNSVYQGAHSTNSWMFWDCKWWSSKMYYYKSILCTSSRSHYVLECNYHCR